MKQAPSLLAVLYPLRCNAFPYTHECARRACEWPMTPHEMLCLPELERGAPRKRQFGDVAGGGVMRVPVAIPGEAPNLGLGIVPGDEWLL